MKFSQRMCAPTSDIEDKLSPPGELQPTILGIVEDSLCLVKVVGPPVVDVVAKCGSHHSKGI